MEQYNFSLDQGSTFSMSLSYKDPANNVLSLRGISAKMQFRSTLSTSSKLLEISTDDMNQMWVSPAGDTLNIKIPHTLTATLPPSVIVYDIEVTFQNGNVLKILKGVCRVIGEVTR